VPARLEVGGDGWACVSFAVPQAGVAPGQACVFYQGTRVLGGGWIERAPLAADV
jgi:tRNA-specific 2-thiouridylase